jgi:hypothetical protein
VVRECDPFGAPGKAELFIRGRELPETGAEKRVLRRRFAGGVEGKENRVTEKPSTKLSYHQTARHTKSGELTN